MEIAGLLLSTISAFQVVQLLTERVAATKSFPRKLRALKKQIALEKAKFESECQFLFPPDIEWSLAKEMLVDENHPKWRDRGFREKFRENLDGYEEEIAGALSAIRETIEELDGEVERVTVVEKPGPLNQALGLYKKLQRPSSAPTLDKLLDSLRAQILSVLLLRKQRQDAQKRRYKAKEPKRSSLRGGLSERLPQVIEMQKASERVYAAIASVAKCSCHSFYFRLQCETPEKEDRWEDEYPEDKPTTAGSNFKLFLTSSENQSTAPCTCLTVRKEADLTPPLPAYSLLPPKPVEGPQKKKTKQLQFVFSPNESTGSLNPTLTDLCSTIRSLAAPTKTPSYLGALPSTDAHRHLYGESLQPVVPRISLLGVFMHPSLSGMTSIFPQDQRYQLAWTLSASVLRFGFKAASWFRQNWRTGDIYFMHPNKAKLDEAHISVQFNPSTSPGTCLATNEKLYSLALALIEIAFCKTIRELCAETEPAEQQQCEWNHVREYAGAKRLIEMVGQHMGRRYMLVVKRCFYCNFAIDVAEITDSLLQSAFYEKVECELRRCIEAFSG